MVLTRFVFKKLIHAGNDLLLNISLTGGQLLKEDKSWARSVSDLSTYDWPTKSNILNNISLPAQIYFNSNTKKRLKIWTNPLDSTTIPTTLTELEFPVNIVWTEMHIFTYIFSIH